MAVKNYLTKGQVIAKFKLEVLPLIKKEVGEDFDTIQHCWDVTLEQLVDNKSISYNQRSRWKLKESDLI